MTIETRMRAVNEAVKATGGHNTTSRLSVDELKDVKHRAALQTPIDTALSDKNTQQPHRDIYIYYTSSLHLSKNVFWTSVHSVL